MIKQVKQIIIRNYPNLYSKLVITSKAKEKIKAINNTKHREKAETKKFISKIKKHYKNVRYFNYSNRGGGYSYGKPIIQTGMGGYSQFYQDNIVYKNFFEGKKDGVFCDIGGNHPVNINNTLYFEELGWKGIAFEPVPHMAKLWEQYRKVKLFPVALSDSEGEVVFTVVENSTGWEDALSYIKSTSSVDYEESHKLETKDIKIKTKIFKDIIEKENISHIDYMSLDVEGHELNVLKGIDFNKVSINVLTIENEHPDNHFFGNDDIREFMLSKGYILWGRIHHLDDIYVHNTFLKNKKH